MHSVKTNGSQSNMLLQGVRQEAISASDPKEQMHILLVDDDKWIVQIGQRILENLGYQVTGHTSGIEALEAVRQQREQFDLVITDFIMPQMNGLELARELNCLCPGLPIIIFSASERPISLENAKEIGIKDYLMKPVRAAKLQHAIRQVLDARLPEGSSNK